MDTSEIQRFLDVSLAHSVVVDVREVAEAPGTLRTVTIHQGNDVTIEFEACADYAHGTGESGGLKYVGSYETLDALIADLEGYLGAPVSDWTNYTTTPYQPMTMVEPEPDKNLKYFESMVRDRAMPLPSGGAFENAGIYWRHIELFGEYRPDRLGEETDVYLQKRGVSTDEEGND